MSRVGKYPVEIPPGVQVAVAERPADREGHARRAEAAADRACRDDGRGRQGRREAARRGAPGAHHVGHHARADRQHGEGRVHRLQRSMEITGTGFRAAVQGKNLELSLGLLASGGLSGAGRHQDHLRAADGDQGRGRRQAAGRPGGRRRSARSVRPSRTRARACATTTSRSAARKARRSDERACRISRQRRRERLRFQLRQKSRRPAAAFGVPLRQEHLCAGDRRRGRAARWRRLVARQDAARGPEDRRRQGGRGGGGQAGGGARDRRRA